MAASLCALPANAATVGGVLAWGKPDYDVTIPPPDALTGVTAVSAGSTTALALKGGAVLAWGANNWGANQIPAAATSGVSQIASGWGHELALKSGKVLAWGNNWYGQTTLPASVSSGVIAISTSNMHSLALKQGGLVVSWGTRTDVAGRRADGRHRDFRRGRPQPGHQERRGAGLGEQHLRPGDGVEAGLTSGVTTVSAGFNHSLALKGGRVYAWGRDSLHQTEVPPEAQSGVVGVDAGFNHNVAYKADGTVVSWGSNVVGESTFIWCGPVFGVSAGDNDSFALKEDPAAAC